MATQQLT